MLVALVLVALCGVVVLVVICRVVVLVALCRVAMVVLCRVVVESQNNPQCRLLALLLLFL
jgi:hypothetical protein